MMDYLSLCLICKDENDYLPEWLDYHILMGVDRFYIYDNESRVSLRTSLADYITRGWVIVMDIPGKAVQLFAYDHCLQTFGENTFWMGFIDTDEFLVPESALNLKDFLKDYEEYGGLGVSSLFFGSNHHQNRPQCGQIAGYTLRTHQSFYRNNLIKSIVQPSKTLMPNSPHDFVFKENAWCVNENFQRVDYQMFPNHTDKIQLNHYFCRSLDEIDHKLNRGRGDDGIKWFHDRFESVNLLASIKDTTIIQNLQNLFSNSQLDIIITQEASDSTCLLDQMAGLARTQTRSSLQLAHPDKLSYSQEFINFKKNKDEQKLAGARNDFEELRRLNQANLQLTPSRVIIYVNLAVCFLNLNDPGSAWQALSQAWKLAPNSYSVLLGMANFFLRVADYQMAEKTCQILFNMAPEDLLVLSYLTESLIGLGRCEEAVKLGIPVVELASLVGELPEGMNFYLIQKIAGCLEQMHDNVTLTHLWELGIKCQKDKIEPVLELIKVLRLVGDLKQAREWLVEAQKRDPKNDEVLNILHQLNTQSANQKSRKRNK